MATIAAVRQHPGRQFSFPRITRPSVSAGTTVFMVYIFAGLTIQVGVLAQLGISGPEASSWFFITWMTTGLFSLALSLFTKQPVSINLSIAALVFIAGSASGFSLAQILGANLAVGRIGGSAFPASTHGRLRPHRPSPDRHRSFRRNCHGLHVEDIYIGH